MQNLKSCEAPNLAVIYCQPHSGEFRHDLLSCCNSCSDCITAHFCPNFYAYCASQDAGEGTLMSCFQCFTFPLCLCCLRSAARGKKSIDGNIFLDCCASYFCPFCTIIQIRREFRS
ncbi:PLANT CADMIUM RESISTANCE 2-like [Brachionus plicatilis]|uniref:PLANT CADMIUM RESISTANCE 2-like n=1 Tax=Brachionus plicatilis TaxID=10195 RepID=A0A3M7PR16_BRAPC|nr:PLANT CADMIUM RESISTANCE 2-like [Brachionus plicatilis]